MSRVSSVHAFVTIIKETLGDMVEERYSPDFMYRLPDGPPACCYKHKSSGCTMCNSEAMTNYEGDCEQFVADTKAMLKPMMDAMMVGMSKAPRDMMTKMRQQQNAGVRRLSQRRSGRSWWLA